MNKIIVLLLLLSLAGVSTAASIQNWLQLDRLQKSPVAFGIMADGGYKFNSTDSVRYDYGLAAELLFPLISTARLRARLLELHISPGSSDLLVFNSALSLDAMVAYPLPRMRVYPYAYVGAGCTVSDQIQFTRYSLRGGLGVEGRVAQFSNVFAEVGAANSFPGNKVIEARAAAGVRFGL
jgi:hypothetical protein